MALIEQVINTIKQSTDGEFTRKIGRVCRVVGLMIESNGPSAFVGERCFIMLPSNESVEAEVVGFNEERVLLMPYGETTQIAPGCLVKGTGKMLQVPVGEELIGQVLDGLGRPLSGERLVTGKRYDVQRKPPNPLNRPRILDALSTGVRMIDGLLTVGKGQRVGLFAGSGVGKSTLLGMIAKRSSADINVIALIGERGREVKEFIEKELGPEGMARSVVIVATSDQPPLVRLKGAYTATAIAEYFRDQGKEVVLMMDSVTRFAMAQREIGLATGEPPTSKGYTPSVFAMLPQLLERSGTAVTGSITAFYTVLVDGDDMNEPIADAVRGILDGHFVMDRALANRGQFPAIHVLKSISRVMNQIASPSHREAAQTFRSWLATYIDAEDLINIGAYKKGSNPAIDTAIEKYPYLLTFLKQSIEEDAAFQQTMTHLSHIARGES
ncbi:flagellar protein export ATPase FliI [Exiguobacterium sp. AT1b]|uniref:flagellar protein export ATPase FliI n=1 Tax=Exiguobacterium sp. (strain ATCC BAA-1283 / AT1b) TaxID=360911 RepID=UPI00093E90A6|nr:flagellar protein export ATPase FliI [Exiguobacterium sp. AT1b]